MKKLIFIIWLSLLRAQEMIWNSSVSFNNFGWLPWDYSGDNLVYYSDNVQYSCRTFEAPILCNIDEPLVYLKTLVPNYFIISDSHLYFNDIDAGFTFRITTGGRRTFYSFGDSSYLKEFQSIHVVKDYFYISYNSLEILMFDLKEWDTHQLHQTVIQLNKMDYFWHIKSNAVFSIRVNKEGTTITNYMIYSTKVEWDSSVPFCNPTDPENQVFVASSQKITFLICNENYLIYLYHSSLGSLIGYYPIEAGTVKAMECSDEFVFILYEDASVWQYNLNFDYIFTYKVDKTKTPSHNNVLKVGKDYLFYVLCLDNNPSEWCNSPYISQWRIVKSSPKVPIYYTSSKISHDKDSVVLKSETSMIFNAEFMTSPNLNNVVIKQNSYFSPEIYSDEKGETHLIYFSGSGNIAKGLNGDVLLHDTQITELITGKTMIHSTRVVQIYPILNYPLREYASYLMVHNKSFFYVIHGGITNDYKTISLDMFSIDISKKEYLKIPQEYTIP